MEVTINSGGATRIRHDVFAASDRKEAEKFGSLLDQIRMAHVGDAGLGDYVVPNTELTKGLKAYDRKSLKESESAIDQDSNTRSGEGKYDSAPIANQDHNESHLTTEDRSQTDPSVMKSDTGDVKIAETGVNESASRSELMTQKGIELAQTSPAVMTANQALDSNAVSEHQKLLSPASASTVSNLHRNALRGSKDRADKPMNSQGFGHTLSNDEPFAQDDYGLSRLNGQSFSEQRHGNLDAQPLNADLGQASRDLFDSGASELESLNDFHMLADKGVEEVRVSSNQAQGAQTPNSSDEIPLQSDLLNLATTQGAKGALAPDTVKLSGEYRVLNRVAGLMGARPHESRLSQELSKSDRAQAPSTLTELPEDVDELSVVRQLSDELKLRFGKNQTVEVNLNPAELGRVRIQIQMQSENSVNLRVSTEHSLVADLLSMGLAQLKKDLLAQGMQINHVEVNADGHDQSQGRREHNEGHAEGQAFEDENQKREEKNSASEFSVRA